MNIEFKLQYEETFITTEEVVNLFSKNKTFVKTLKELTNNNFNLVKEQSHRIKSNTDFSSTFRTEHKELFEFKGYWTHLNFTHKDGHTISLEIGLNSNFKISKDGYTQTDLITAKELINKSFDINSDTLKVKFNNGEVFLADENASNKNYRTGVKGYTDTIEGGFNTVIRCLNDEEYCFENIGLANALA